MAEAAEVGYDVPPGPEGAALWSGWRRGEYRPALVSVVEENYGGYGSLAQWDFTPTHVPPKWTEYDPYIPQFNNLDPIIWEEYVLHPEEVAALAQAGLIQNPGQSPMFYSPPGTAGL